MRKSVQLLKYLIPLFVPVIFLSSPAASQCQVTGQIVGQAERAASYIITTSHLVAPGTSFFVGKTTDVIKVRKRLAQKKYMAVKVGQQRSDNSGSNSLVGSDLCTNSIIYLYTPLTIHFDIRINQKEKIRSLLREIGVPFNDKLVDPKHADILIQRSNGDLSYYLTYIDEFRHRTADTQSKNFEEDDRLIGFIRNLATIKFWQTFNNGYRDSGRSTFELCCQSELKNQANHFNYGSELHMRIVPIIRSYITILSIEETEVVVLSPTIDGEQGLQKLKRYNAYEVKEIIGQSLYARPKGNGEIVVLFSSKARPLSDFLPNWISAHIIGSDGETDISASLIGPGFVNSSEREDKKNSLAHGAKSIALCEGSPECIDAETWDIVSATVNVR